MTKMITDKTRKQCTPDITRLAPGMYMPNLVADAKIIVSRKFVVEIAGSDPAHHKRGRFLLQEPPSLV
ncbi:hypothetical protein B0I18_10334 [Taibaiella chishuiensis]|uniref:Uncharacterized protein n=2 Tax=Taibaiella chishuiensis TaxID=1434707 RepID=A0A2P8D5G7_9BACT|nr:hypothetical protein B0I18_10334 [Taibaiella chishuiensis]